MILLTQNQLYLKHLPCIATHKCNGMNDTYFYALNVTFFIYPEFYLLLPVTAKGTKTAFM